MKRTFAGFAAGISHPDVDFQYSALMFAYASPCERSLSDRPRFVLGRSRRGSMTFPKADMTDYALFLKRFEGPVQDVSEGEMTVT
jgi:hypothetical protein